MKKANTWTPEDFQEYFSKKKGKKTDRTTGGMTSELIGLLKSIGFDAWRQNNTATYDPKIKKHRSFTGRLGIGDVIGFHRKYGLFLSVEIKNKGDKMSIHQDRFKNELNESGGIAEECRNVGDCISRIKKRIKEYDRT